ncbi:MAG: GNAT family N-acetyltransferase [Candidatus Dormibacteria bacterium]
MTDLPLRWATFGELSLRTFHDIVRLRLAVFVEEQRCPYAELDGRDVLATARHGWISDASEVVSYLRTYEDADGTTWIGRVVTARSHRRRGLAGRLMRDALARSRQPVRLSAQSHLVPWYGSFGLVRCGEDFDEDGIRHTPMLLR